MQTTPSEIDHVHCTFKKNRCEGNRGLDRSKEKTLYTEVSEFIKKCRCWIQKTNPAWIASLAAMATGFSQLLDRLSI